VQHELVDFQRIRRVLEEQTRDKAAAEAELLAAAKETQVVLSGEKTETGWLQQFCQKRGILAASIIPGVGVAPVASYGRFPVDKVPPAVTVEMPAGGAFPQGLREARRSRTCGCRTAAKAIEEYDRAFNQLGVQRRAVGSTIRCC